MAEETIRKLFDGFNNKDYDAIVALVADDFELIDCASGERYTGPEGARRNAEGRGGTPHGAPGGKNTQGEHPPAPAGGQDGQGRRAARLRRHPLRG